MNKYKEIIIFLTIFNILILFLTLPFKTMVIFFVLFFVHYLLNYKLLYKATWLYISINIIYTNFIIIWTHKTLINFGISYAIIFTIGILIYKSLQEYKKNKKYIIGSILFLISIYFTSLSFINIERASLTHGNISENYVEDNLKAT